MGARSKTLDLSESSQTKSSKVSTSGNVLNRLAAKSKASTNSEFELDGTSKIKDKVSQLKTASLEKDSEKLPLASPGKAAHSGITLEAKKSVLPVRNIFLPPQDAPSSSLISKSNPKGAKSSKIVKPSHLKNEAGDISEEKRIPGAPSLIPVRKVEGKIEQKRKSVKMESSKPNRILSATSTKLNTKPNVINSKKDSDAKVETTLANERDLEKRLLDSCSVKSTAHSGIIFVPKKKLTYARNIFTLHKDGSSNDDQSSNILHQPSLENPKPVRKTQHKDATNEAAEKTRSGKKSVAPTKKKVTAQTDKASSSKMTRSKTEVTISTNPGPIKSLPKVQSFSRLKPQPLIKKPAHQAILDVTALVKGSPKVELPPKTSAHSGVPFIPKKPLTLPAVNLFANIKDGKEEFLKKTSKELSKK